MVRGSFRVGLTMCLICGVLGTAFVYGGKSGIALAAARYTGARPMLASYAAYVVTISMQ